MLTSDLFCGFGKIQFPVAAKGSCNLQCQRGALKASGAYFKFFCPEAVKGAFVAKVWGCNSHKFT